MKYCSTLTRLTLDALVIPTLAIACSGETKRSTTDSSATGNADASGNGEGTRIDLADKMNYVFHSSLSAVTTPVRANSDISFDWSIATVDMLGRKLDPLTGVDMMQLMLWRYDKSSFLAGINKEELEIGRLVAMGYCDAQHVRTSCRFFDLVGPAGSPISQDTLRGYVNPKTYPPGEHVWVIMLATGSVFGRGTRLLAFFQPSEGETNTEVRLTNDSTTLDYAVDLTKLQPIAFPQHAGDIMLSWADDSQLTKNGMGAAWVSTRITDVAIAHYVGYTVADLERQFLLLQDLASEYYGVRLNAGQEVLLSRLADQAGRPFPGIDDNGIWLFSLTCGTCRNPAPWFLSILSPRN